MGQKYMTPEEHAKNIKEKAEAFYQAIYDANADGLSVDHDVLDYYAFGDKTATPKVTVKVIETPRSWSV